MAAWTYAGSVMDGLRFSQRVVDVLGRDAVSIVASLDAGGMVAALGRLGELAQERTAAAKLAAADGVDTDDAAAALAAMQAVRDVVPADVVSSILDRLTSPEALDLLADAARLCHRDGEPVDLEAPGGPPIGEVLTGVLSVMRGQALFS